MCFMTWMSACRCPGSNTSAPHRTYEKDGYVPKWRAIRDDKGRIIVAICHNMHLGDAWEWADDPDYPEPFASMAFGWVELHRLRHDALRSSDRGNPVSLHVSILLQVPDAGVFQRQVCPAWRVAWLGAAAADCRLHGGLALLIWSRLPQAAAAHISKWRAGAVWLLQSLLIATVLRPAVAAGDHRGRAGAAAERNRSCAR